MADAPHCEELLKSLGEFVGKMDAALATFWHPAAHRHLVSHVYVTHRHLVSHIYVTGRLLCK
jgi:Ser/Thr protein kinase RdoA (MazF antagonist)